jgi:serine/threonine protein kinase
VLRCLTRDGEFVASRENTRRFHFLREIASGGFGSVYLAKIMHADGFSRLAAVKLLHQRWSANQEIAQRMRDEARLLGWLRHRNIVDVIDLTTIGGRVAVIMEYLEAVDLKSVIQRHLQDQKTIPIRAALETVAFVASALDAAYNRPPYQGEKPLRVIHRDIKPSNIMVDETGTVKVLDFGVARADFDMRESHTQELPFGSVDYMPPERLFFEPETPFSDTYSLGATLYELLTLEKLGKAKGRAERHAAFVEERLVVLSKMLPHKSQELENLLREMLAYQHDARPASADVVQRCRALARVFEGDGVVEWGEQVVGPLVKQQRDAPREPNPLVDSILTEDGAGLVGSDSEPVNPFRSAEEAIMARYETEPPSTKVSVPPPEPVEEEDETVVGADDARWADLLASVRQELQSRPEPAPQESIQQNLADTMIATAGEEPVVEQTFVEPAPAPYVPPELAAPPEPENTDVGRELARAAAPPDPGSFPGEQLIPSRMAVALEKVPEKAPEPSDFDDVPTRVTLEPQSQGPGSAFPVLVATPPPDPDATQGIKRPLPESPAPIVEEEEEIEEEAPPKRSFLLPVIGGLVVIGGGAMVITLILGWYFIIYQPSASAPAQPVVQDVVQTPPAATPVASPTPALASNAPLQFTASIEGLRKMTVDCDGTMVTGGATVGMSLEQASKCVVTAVLADRSRLMAEVGPVEKGVYTCFAGGEKKCIR